MGLKVKRKSPASAPSSPPVHQIVRCLTCQKRFVSLSNKPDCTICRQGASGETKQDDDATETDEGTDAARLSAAQQAAVVAAATVLRENRERATVVEAAETAKREKAAAAEAAAAKAAAAKATTTEATATMLRKKPQAAAVEATLPPAPLPQLPPPPSYSFNFSSLALPDFACFVCGHSLSSAAATARVSHVKACGKKFAVNVNEFSTAESSPPPLQPVLPPPLPRTLNSVLLAPRASNAQPALHKNPKKNSFAKSAHLNSLSRAPAHLLHPLLPLVLAASPSHLLLSTNSAPVLYLLPVSPPPSLPTNAKNVLYYTTPANATVLSNAAPAHGKLVRPLSLNQTHTPFPPPHQNVTIALYPTAAEGCVTAILGNKKSSSVWLYCPKRPGPLPPMGRITGLILPPPAPAKNELRRRGEGLQEQLASVLTRIPPATAVFVGCTPTLPTSIRSFLAQARVTILPLKECTFAAGHARGRGSAVYIRVCSASEVAHSKAKLDIQIIAVPYDEGAITLNDAAVLLLKYRPECVRYTDGVDRLQEIAAVARERVQAQK